MVVDRLLTYAIMCYPPQCVAVACEITSTVCRFASEKCSPVQEEVSEDNTLNLVLLGKEGLAIALNRDIRVSLKRNSCKKWCVCSPTGLYGVAVKMRHRPQSIPLSWLGCWTFVAHLRSDEGRFG